MVANSTLTSQLLCDIYPDITTGDAEHSANVAFSKLAVHRSTPTQSLITKALTTPILNAMDRNSNFSRGFSSTPYWSLSGASTAELTSDGGLTSRSQSPSPPPPSMLIASYLRHQPEAAPTTDISKQYEPIEVNEDNTIEGLGRKRCIRFECGPPSRRSSTDDYGVMPHSLGDRKSVDSHTSQPPAPIRRNSILRFACQEPPRVAHARTPSNTLRFAATTNAPTQPSNINTTNNKQQEPTPSTQIAIPSSACTTKFYEFASSCDETEPWMLQVPDRSRLLRVDGVLEKEKTIRKLSEEVDAEVQREEEEAEDEDDEDDDEDFEDEAEEWEEEEDEDEDDEDEDSDDDDEDDDSDYEFMSGNESDNEEGFASDSDDNSEGFFSLPRSINIPASFFQRPTCCDTSSSIESLKHVTYRSPRRPSIVDLPDSTDFVCGTFDEDKAIEDAYVSALEEKKRAKFGLTPQDIDPSFPADSDSEDERSIKSAGSTEHVYIRGRMSLSDNERAKGRKNTSILATEKACAEGKIRFHSPAPHRRTISPAPKRRLVSPPPVNRSTRVTPPVSRRGSTEHSPRPTMLRRGSRCTSPPPPVRRNTSHLNFARINIERTKSLPKTTKQSLYRGRSFENNNQTFTPDATTPVRRPRGAIDIVKGLEKKRERRKNKIARQKESYPRPGEGVEKMRELGLMLGKGKQAQWMISA